MKLYWVNKCGEKRESTRSLRSYMWAAGHDANLFPAGPALYYGRKQGWVKV